MRAVSFYTIRMLSSVTVGEFVLTRAERDQLRAWSAGGGRLAVRARIVLACSEPGVVYARLADELGVSVMTVHNVRRRFFESRMAGLVDRPRSAGQHLVGLVTGAAEHLLSALLRLRRGRSDHDVDSRLRCDPARSQQLGRVPRHWRGSDVAVGLAAELRARTCSRDRARRRDLGRGTRRLP